MMRLSISIIFSLLACSSLCRAEAPVFRSGSQPGALVELFTSQGCSSCPPADAWLSGLQDDSGLWIDFVPVAWHVDYWDHLGWRDTFGSARFSARQRDYARSGGLGVVYTPGILVDGLEWRGWRSGAEIPRRAEPVGQLVVEVVGDQALVRFAPAAGAVPGPWRVEGALLGMDLQTPVASGENRGRTLTESFVVLDHQVSEPCGGETASWRLPIAEGDAGHRRALAVWVSQARNSLPLQAVGGWLP
jgi:hypothetical protein